MDIESNQGVINQPANLTPDTANKSLQISQQLGIDVDPVKNFTEVQKLNSDISPEATSLRSVANESNENASLIKKDAKQLSDLEKYSRNIKLKIKSDDLRDQANSLILKQSELRKTNKDLTEDEMFELDRLELMNEEIQIQQEQLGLNMTESALTGDLVGVFRDMGVQAKESPVISGLGALGFIGGPGLGVTTMLLANTAAGVPYNYDRTFAQTYRDLEGQKDDNGNELPNDLKIGIARVSAGAQTFLETGSELVMTGAGKLWGKYVSKGAGKAASGVAEKALEKAAKNPKFREKILALAGDVSKAGLSEAVTEVLQDMISDTAVNTGKSWDQSQGLDITKGVEKTIENLDFSRVWETGYRSAITGGAASIGFRGGQKVLDKGVNAWYERKNGKRLNIDENNNVVEEDVPPTTPPPSGPRTFNGSEPATKLPTNRNTSFVLVPEIDGGKTKEELKQDPGNQRKTVLMKDGEPKNLSRNEAILLGVVKSNSDTASDYGIGENQIALEKLQLEEAEKNGLNVMFVDKESLEDWATTDERKKAVAELFLGDKGAYLGKQKVPLTKEQYYKLQGFGDKEFLNDSTSITSDGMTLGQLKDVIKQLGDKAKNLPKPSGIESSPEQNTAGKVDLSTSGVNVPTDTTHLGVDSTDQEIASTLNNQQQADAYLKRLADEEAALSVNESVELFHGTRADFEGDLDPSLSGGMVNYTENQNVAEGYAQGGGGGRRYYDPSRDKIKSSYSDTEFILNNETGKYDSVIDGEVVSLTEDQVNSALLGESDNYELYIEYDNARVIKGSYNPKKTLDITNKDNPNSEKNAKILFNILKDLAKKGNKTAGNIASNSKSESSFRKHDLEYISSAWWGMTKFARGEEIGNDLKQITEALKDKGYESLRFADDGDVTVAVFDNQQSDVDTTKLGPDSTDQEIASTLKNKKQADAYLGRLVNDIKAVHNDKSIKGTPIIHYSPNKFAKNKSDYVWGYNKDAPISSMYGSNRYEYTLTEDANIVKIEDIPSDFTDLDNPSDVQKKYFKDNNIDAILRHSADGLDQIVVVNKDKLDQSKTERLYNLTTIFDRVAKLIPDLPDVGDNQQSDVDTTKLGPDSTDEDILNTLKNKKQVDSYLKRLNDEANKISSSIEQRQFKGLEQNYTFDKEPESLTPENIEKLAEELYNQFNDDSQLSLDGNQQKIDDYRGLAREILRNGQLENVDDKGEYVFKPKNNAELNASTLYHGSKSALLKDLEDNKPGVFGNAKSLFGNGLYLTDKPSVAFSYAGEDYSKVLSLKLDNTKLLNLEERLPKVVYDKITSKKSLEGVFDSFKKIPKGVDLFEELNNFMESENMDSDSIDLIYQEIQSDLIKLGYSGFSHIGGTRVGKEGFHNVVILFPDYDTKQNIKGNIDTKQGSRIQSINEMYERVLNLSDQRESNNSERIEQIKRMRERVEALKGSLPDEPLFTPDIDTAIDKFENFGDITEGLYDLLPESEREFFRAEITRVKELMKRNFKDEIMTEFDETATIAEREANIIAQDEAIDAALNDDRSIIVDSFLAEKALRIDYDTLSDEQKAKFDKEDGYLKKRKVFKAKDGMHIEEVAAQMGVESDALLDALANALSTEQSVQAKVKVAEARNKAESRKQTDINFEAIENTINDVTKLKRDMLNTILKTNPNAAMKLMHSIFKAGAQTAIENVNINAKDLTENTRIGNLKPSSYLNASRRHFNSAIRSILKTKDLAQGSKNIEQSMIADELHKASRVTKRKVDKVIDSIVRKYGDKKLLSQLEATGHLEAFKAVLSLIGKGKINEGDMGSLKQLMIEWTEKGIESDSNLPATLTESEAIQESVARDKEVDINDLTFSQLETVNSILNQIVQDSNNARKDRITDQRLYENGMVQAAKDDVANNPYKDGSKAKSYSKGGSGWIKESLNTLLGVAHTIKMNDDMIDWFKISNDGLLGNLWKQIKGVGVFATGMGEQGYNQLSAKVKDLLNESIGAKNWKRLQSYAGQRIYVPEFANTDGLLGRDGMIRKTNLIGMLLVYGSKEGRDRLKKFGLDMDTLIPTIEKYLHKDDIKIVEAIWKAHDFLKPGIVYVEKTLRGVNNVEFIEPEPFIWNGKETTGGYIHLTYSTDQKSTLTIKEKDVVADLLSDENIVNSNNAARDFTKEGFKKVRAKNLNMYLNLDLNTMMNSSLNNIITNNTMLIPIYNTMRLLNNKEIENQYIQVMGKDAFAIFKKNVLQSGMNQDVGMLDNIKSWNNLGNVIGYVSSNFMKSKIYSSVSSIFNQFLSFVTIAGKHATEPSIMLSTGIFWLKMVANPKSVRTLINELAEHMPSIKTDIASYAQTTVRSFKLIEGSESGNRLIKGFVNANNTLGDLWLSKIMGGLDEFNKTAYALALLQKYHNGKLGTDKAKLNEMGDVERKNEGFAKVDKMVRQIFPDKNITSSSYAQNNRLISQFLPFFNDARRTLNSVYFPRLKDMWEAVTLFPEDVAKRGLAKAAVKSSKDIVLNTIVLHVYASMIDALIGSFRGEDEEDDTKGDKEWPERVFDRAIRNLTDPFAVPKNIADNTPIVSGYKFFLETDARFGGVNLPIAQWGESAVRTIGNLYNVGFNDGEMNDREMKDLMMTMSGLTLVPLSVVNNYIYGESTAFKTGFISTSVLGAGVGVIAGVGAVGGLPLVAAGAALGVTGLGLGMYKDLGGLLSDAEKKVMKPSDNQELNAFNQSNYDALYESLLQDQNGRNQLISMVDKNEIAVMSPEDLDNLIFVESKGDPLARPLDKGGNQLSSALGIGQFLIGTWNDVLKRHPELYGEVYPAYADETEIPDGEIDGRTDPQQTLKVLEYFHKDIWKALVKEGVRPYVDNIYTGHHFGEGMVVPLAKADADQSLRSVFVKNVGVNKWNKTLRANGWLDADMTVGEFREGINDLLTMGAIDKAKWESKNNIVFDPYNL